MRPYARRLLADPLVQALMSADHVDAAGLRRQMNRTASRIAQPLDISRVRFATSPRKPGDQPRLRV